ncbi:MAG TPA: TonB-dependent receptor [Blastocatellia bacterium]|jgi:iron complex outermembrane receptor protein|nr:TonB-dependent receptor [Blastocatellia bacterium]
MKSNPFLSILPESIIAIVIALLITGANAQVNAQSASSISGRVMETNGAVIPQVKVTLREVATGRIFSTLSRQDGSFSLSGLDAGRYFLIASRPGLAEYRQEINLAGAAPQSVEITLRPAELNESIIVRAEGDSYQATESSTATKLASSWLDVPQSVQVVNRRLLNEQADFQLSDAVRNISGVSRTKTQTSGSLGNEFTLRGFQLDIENNYLRDGLKYSGYSVSDLADVEQVEVLKGPAAALYGRSEPGGVINLISKKPLDSPFVSVQFTGANGDFYRPELDLSGPIGQIISYRLNAAYQRDFNFVDFAGGQHYFLAPSLLWRPTNTTTLLLTGEALRANGVSDYGIPAVGNRPAPVPTSRFYGEPFNHYSNHPLQAAYLLHHNFSSRWSIENRFSYARAGNKYIEAFPYALGSDGRAVLRSVDSFGFPEDSRYSQTEAVGDFRTGALRHNLLFGLEFGWTNGYFLGAIADAPPIDLYQPVYGSVTREQAYQALTPANPSYFAFNIATRTNSIAGYVQDRIDLSSKLKFLVGARVERYKQKSEDRSSNSVDRLTNLATSPRVGLVFTPTQNTSLYFSYVRSFVPQPPSAFDKSGKTFEPSHARQYEVGVKRSALAGRIAATVAAYWIEKDNVLTVDPTDPRFSLQTGTQRSKGIDLDIVGQILPGWNVWAAYAFNQAQITRDNTFPVGNFLTEAPRHSGNVWTSYEFSRGRIRGLGLGGGLYAIGAKQGDLFNSYLLPGYARVDASVYYEFRQSDRKTGWRFSVNIKNALNRKYWEASNSGFARGGNPIAVYSTLKWTWY